MSIPSPPPEWKQLHIPYGEWLHAIFPAVDASLSLRITTYAIVIIVGIFAAVLLTNRRLTRRGAEPWIIVDVGIWAVVLGIIGARLYHVATHPDDYFGPGHENWWNPFVSGSIWAIWEGGGAIFGALIFGALGVWIGCRITGLRFWTVADAIAPTLLVAQAFGRLGNWFNQELFGLPTDLPWGLEIDRPNAAIPEGIPDDVLFHPTFLYEILWNLAGFVLIILVTEKITRVPGKLLPLLTRRDNWQWGKVLGLYLVWYGVGRSWFESIRLDPSETFLGIRSNVWAALGAILLGLIIIAVQSRRHPGVEPDAYQPGRRPESAAAVDSEDTYSDSDEPGDGASEVTEAAATSGSTRTK
ncbi:prolipoprotein diacylglyceryl transferase [Protaetiibacter intestinalis]|uniref:Phosphatidylglycerol--prolipoprotein diacylglyceryl transferase n=1 Tax=Protaetiibacter intestinalis TaxID=2419774 RepID=A0A387B761_9MICO|nr:prolipoprotein diacylglyceryl transferase [Protaetiibacter intestinalis]